MMYCMNASHPFEKTVFPNGTRLLLVPMEGVESIATSVMVAAGSRYETPAISGISHFLEHMVFKGTDKYPTTDDVNFIERLGGLQNAYTDIDVTCYHNKVLGEDWKAGLEINKELALNPRLEERHVDKERDVILEEMKKYEDEPAMKVGELFHEMLYPGTKLGMRIIGEEQSLRSATSATLRAYHTAWYQPERMVVVLAGNLGGKRRQECVKETSDWFGSKPPVHTGAMDTVSDKQAKPVCSILQKKDAQQAHITLGVRTFSRSSADRFAWSVFNLLFGVSFTSRLFREIREKRGLCYTVRSSADQFADVGYWSIYAGVATEKVSETVSAIMEQLRLVVADGVKEEEVSVAIKRIKTMLSFRAEDPEFMNEWFGRQELYNQDILTLSSYLENISAVTKADIDRLVRKYIVTNTLNLAVVWNRPEEHELVQLLTI